MPYINNNVVLNIEMYKLLLNFGSTVNKSFVQRSEVRIYERKHERKKKQENTLSTKKVMKKNRKKKENTLSTTKAIKK